MVHKMKIFRKACCWLLIAAFLFSFVGCASASDNKIDWNLSGVWVNKDGTVRADRSQLDISVSGTLPLEFENREQVEMDLAFTWPNGIVQHNDDQKKYIGHAQYADKHKNQAFYLVSTWLYYTDRNDFTSISFLICPDEGFIVAHLGDDYLVASTNTNADPAEIFAFYKTYVHVS